MVNILESCIQNQISKLLINFNPNYNVKVFHTDQIIKKNFGGSASGLDHVLVITEKNSYQAWLITIQDKFQNNQPKNVEIHALINATNYILKNYNYQFFLAVFVSKMPMTSGNLELLEKENSQLSENKFLNIDNFS